ncbi:hypothetical protein DsansV1_C06g0067801 [Dioscorea sansibarensis]
MAWHYRSSSLAWVVILLVLLLFYAADASVHDYTGEKFVAKGNAFVLHGGSEGLYASVPSPNSTLPDNGDSSIRFEKIIFTRSEEEAASKKDSDKVTVQAIVFEVEDRDTIGGSAYGGQKAVCCTPDLAKLGVCTEGTIIYRVSTRNPDWPLVFTATFEGRAPAATLAPETVHITRTGMYNLYFIHCDPSLDGLVIEGKTIWKNPTGYLPGRMAPLLNFFGFMSLAFVVLGIFWFSQYARFWREVMPLQNCITLVIALGMFEMALWYFEYAEFNETGIRPRGITFWAVTFGAIKRTIAQFNETGIRPRGITFWAVTFGAIKRTIARVLILVVSMGFGVVRPTLGGLTSKVVMLGTTFFLASEVLELVENVGAVSDLSGKTRLFLVPCQNTGQASARRLMVKLDIYRKFTNALAVAVLVSVGWICYELYFKSTDVYNERWQSAWIIPAFWHVLSFSLLCVICALWAPSQNSMRYAYSGDASEDFDRESSLSLIKPGPIPSNDIQKLDAERTSGVDSTNPHNGDIEEDKRE